MNLDISERLQSLGYALPASATAQGKYQPWLVDNGLFQTSGQISRSNDSIITGIARDDASTALARDAAQSSVLHCLALFHQAMADGHEFERVVSLRGFIASAPEFRQQARVLDSASEVLIGVFGERGHHVRSAIGVASLPANAIVELELTIRCGR